MKPSRRGLTRAAQVPFRAVLAQRPQHLQKQSNHARVRAPAALDHRSCARFAVVRCRQRATKPGAANRACEILRAMLKTAREWGELGAGVPDACANIALNPKRPIARHLDQQQLARLGAALEKCPQTRLWTGRRSRLCTTGIATRPVRLTGPWRCSRRCSVLPRPGG